MKGKTSKVAPKKVAASTSRNRIQISPNTELGFLVSKIKDNEATIEEINRFLIHKKYGQPAQTEHPEVTRLKHSIELRKKTDQIMSLLAGCTKYEITDILNDIPYRVDNMKVQL